MGWKQVKSPFKVAKSRNPFKQALWYQEVMESGGADSLTELAQLCNTPRPTISAHLRLLKLDPRIQAEALALDDDDDRLSVLTEARLRHLVGHKVREQRRRFRALLHAK